MSRNIGVGSALCPFIMIVFASMSLHTYIAELGWELSELCCVLEGLSLSCGMSRRTSCRCNGRAVTCTIEPTLRSYLVSMTLLFDCEAYQRLLYMRKGTICLYAYWKVT